MTKQTAATRLQVQPRQSRGMSALWQRIQAHQALILMFLPGLTFFVVFNYLPMGGIVMAFKDYNVGDGIWGSPWVGLANFEKFFGSYYAGRIIRNAILLNVYTLLFSFPMPILLGILLNEVRYSWFKRTVQTITYFPYFIAAVVMVGIVRMLLSPDVSLGIFNQVRAALFHQEPINFLSEPNYFRSIYVTMSIWQGAGFGAIIYLASLASVDLEQYEAAIIDGANRLQLIRYVTLPALIPTMVILLILSISGLLRSGLETILLLYSPATYETADVIETFVYRRGIVGEGVGRPDYSFATAVGLFQSLIGLVLIVLANQLAKKTSDSSLW